MKYEVHRVGNRLEAVTALHGFRVRVSTLSSSHLTTWPVSVHLRGSESEPEMAVDTPKRELRSAAEAIEYGCECARLWIEAMDRHGYL